MLRTLTILVVVTTLALFVAAAFAEDTITPGPGPGARGGPPEGGPPQGRPPRGPDRFFRRHDADKDGKVTLAELLAAAKQMLDEVDANEDGAITPDELEAHHRARRAQRPAGGPPDGERPGREGRRGPGGDGQGPGDRQRPSPDDLFKRLDANEDGVLSLEEFKAGGRPDRRPRPEGDGPAGPPR